MLLRCTLAVAVALLLSVSPMLVEGREASASSTGTIIYVNNAATGTNDGSSWVDAFVDLQDALALAQSGDQIWVAAGTYMPTQVGGVPTSFHLASGVEMYGGFAGGETSLDERDWRQHETILRREGFGPSILIGAGLASGSVLDGFTIRDGLSPKGEQLAAGGAMWLSNSSLHIANCSLINNGADDRGGAIYSTNTTLTVEDCEFVSNGSWFGGAIYGDASNLTIVGSSFHSNSGIFGGGAVFTEGSTVELINCIFQGNSTLSSEDGGAIHARESTVHVVESSFVANTAGGGGGIFSLDSVVTVQQCFFTENVTEFGGSAIRGSEGSVHIVDSIFEDNDADGATVHGYHTLVVERSSFVNTNAFGGGIWMFFGESATIRGCEFIDHDVQFGGGGGLLVTGSGAKGGVVVIEDSLFQDNFVPFQGGAIFIGDGYDVTIERTHVLNNTAAFWSGGIHAGNVDLTIIDSIISGNQCAPGDRPGGLLQQGGNLTVINSVIAGNFPSGIELGSATGSVQAQFINSTFSQNFLELYLREGSHADIENSIIWGLEGSGTCEGICGSGVFPCWCDDSCCAMHDCCPDKFIECGGCEPAIGTLSVSNSIVRGLPPHDVGDDPLFIKPAEFVGEFGNYRLQPGSPAIDAGSNRFVPKDITTDLDGNPRIVAGLPPTSETPMPPAIVDMGAYEFQPSDVPCAFADLNCDGVVDGKDLMMLLSAWGACPSCSDCAADLDGNCIINGFDLLLLLGAWNPAAAG